jgi:hypothetical protein
MIKLTNVEAATIVLHMSIMRKNIKKGFKKNYGIFEGKKYLKIYDGIVNSIGEEVDEEFETIYIDLNEKEQELLYSFLDFYLKQLSSQAEKEGLRAEKEETYQLLQSTFFKLHIKDAV